MINPKEVTHDPESGNYTFVMYYSGRDVSCTVKKEHNKLHVHIDNNLQAELEIKDDDTLVQISGDELPDSSIEFIKKSVLG
ncbi:hypothetical protein [Mucilaginibacter segetis]|uniref:Uncharacterized protein n=1 Tax=Mucilaginibacter segetis TaxID=2793071 RepID=A0A934PRD3_9SPHI|nr:hypothetical protein [Mucilaginibacter segetis]MBK0378057.1 hypothetical protein [Mucilaginibacter segetis]